MTDYTVSSGVTSSGLTVFGSENLFVYGSAIRDGGDPAAERPRQPAIPTTRVR